MRLVKPRQNCPLIGTHVNCPMWLNKGSICAIVNLSTMWPSQFTHLRVFCLTFIWHITDWLVEYLAGLTISEIINMIFKDLYNVMSTCFFITLSHSTSHLLGPSVKPYWNTYCPLNAQFYFPWFLKILFQQLHYECPVTLHLLSSLSLFKIQLKYPASFGIFFHQLLYLVWLKFVTVH